MLSIIIPVYNEVGTLREIIGRVAALNLDKELVIVDDMSTDGSRAVLEELRDRGLEHLLGEAVKPLGRNEIRVLFQPRNSGKGAALRAGFAAATGDVVVIQDADLEYDPQRHRGAHPADRDGIADVTFGSRFIGSPRRALYFWHTVMNRGLTLASNMLNDLNITDMETCYKAFRRRGQGDPDRGEPVRHRARADRQGREDEPAHLRGAHQLPRAHLRGGEEDRLEGRRSRAVLHREVRPATSPEEPVTAAEEIDRAKASHVGGRTLEVFSDTPRLNRWLFSKLAPHVRGDALEIGSGIGNLSGLIADATTSAVLTDVEPQYLDALRRDFAARPGVSVVPYDLDGPPPAAIAARGFDTIIAVNVIEHVKDDAGLVRVLAGLLRPGGKLVVYVPACPFAYGSLDRALGHYRRYTRSSLSALLAGAGLRPVPPAYMNGLGLIGWTVNGRLLRRRNLPPRQIQLFERLVPLLSLEDRVRLPVGLGLHTAAVKG